MLLTALILFLATSNAFSSETGRYLVPVQKSELQTGRESVCVLEQCYYIVDKISAERSVMSGEAGEYYPEVIRKLHAPNDFRYSEQWSLRDSAINWTSGWERIKDLPAGSDSIGKIPVVAVIDTGLAEHEDLPSSVLYWIGDANGTSPSNGGIDDHEHGHGTHVAGIIGALTNNYKGVASSGGGKVRIMSIRVSSPCKEEGKTGCMGSAAILDAIGKVLEEKGKGADIVAVNMSYGGDSYYTPEFDAMKQLSDHGIIAVVSAGNDRQNLDISGVEAYPAEYDLPNIVTVAAVGSNLNNLANYSNYGSAVDIAAPGTDILSLDNKSYNKYAYMSGTSMAAPFIAGLLGAGAALYNKDKGSFIYPDITCDQLVNILYNTAYTANYPINNGRLVNAGTFFRIIEECRDEAKNTGTVCAFELLPPAPPPAPPPPSSANDNWDDDSGGCSLATGDKGGLPALLLFLAIPLYLIIRRREGVK
jgi:hypothetical protein